MRKTRTQTNARSVITVNLENVPDSVYADYCIAVGENHGECCGMMPDEELIRYMAEYAAVWKEFKKATGRV